jgi:catalase
MTMHSVEYDALVVAGGPGAAEVGADPYTALNLGEAYRHYKPIAACGEGRDVLEACAVTSGAEGVVTGARVNRAFANDLIAAIGWHRHWGRESPQSNPDARKMSPFVPATETQEPSAQAPSGADGPRR